MTTTLQKTTSSYTFSNATKTSQSPRKILVKKNKSKNGKIISPIAKVAKLLTVKVLDDNNQPVEDMSVILGSDSRYDRTNFGQGKTNSKGEIKFNVTHYPIKDSISIHKKYYCGKSEEISINSKNKQDITITTRTITPVDIIDMMKKNGWHRGAKHMQEWVRRAGSERKATNSKQPLPSARKWAYDYPSTIFLIDFDDIINNFSRAKWVYNIIMHGPLELDTKTEVTLPPYYQTTNYIRGTPIWKSSASKVVLKNIALRMEEQYGLISAALSAPHTKVKFGDLNAPIQEIHSEKNEKMSANDPNVTPSDLIKSKAATYYNQQVVSSKARDFFIKDDLTNALANFTINVAAEGYIIADSQRKVTLNITQIGLFIQDSYDFIDDNTDTAGKWLGSQPLGSWNPDTAELANTSFFNGECSISVDNKFFNRWRDKNHKGGDYVVYSNVHKVPVSMTIDIK